MSSTTIFLLRCSTRAFFLSVLVAAQTALPASAEQPTIAKEEAKEAALIEETKGASKRSAAEQQSEGTSIKDAMKHEAAPAQAVAVEQSPSHQRALGITARDMRLRLSAEPGLASPGEGQPTLGLFGIHADTIVDDVFHVGVSGFGAAKGRGGFFGAGLNGMLRYPIALPVSFEAGATIGAGGGGGAPAGTGIFLRPRAGLHVDLGDRLMLVDGVGIGVSHITFPNGDIESTHLDFSIETAFREIVSFERFGSRTATDLLDDRVFGVGRRSFRPTGHAYFLIDSLTRAGEDLGTRQIMAGFEYREWITEGLFGTIEPRALMLGGTAGYMELTVGGGYSIPVDPAERVAVFASGGIGGAGGGGADTGGGVFLRGALGVDVDLPGPAYLGVDGGIQNAPRGEFTAVSAGLRLGLSQETIRPRRLAIRSFDGLDAVTETTWRLRGGHQTYFDAPRGDGEGMAIHLMGLKLDYFANPHLYLTGQGASAYAGIPGAGAFSTAVIGFGGVTDSWQSVRLTAEGRLGTSGGGGIDVDWGLLIQPMAGVLLALTDSVGLELLGGWMVAPTGDMSSASFEAGLTYSFNTPVLRDR